MKDGFIRCAACSVEITVADPDLQQLQIGLRYLPGLKKLSLTVRSFPAFSGTLV